MSRVSLLCLCLGVAACGGVKAAPPDLAQVVDVAPQPLDASGADSSEVLYPNCSDPRADIYKPPITKTSAMGLFHVALSSATPAPPQKSTSLANANEWTMTIADANETPLAGAVVTAKPWMPDMGHGTPVVAKVTAGASAGDYAVGPLFFFMDGFWATTFTIQATASSPSDTVVFSFCIADGTAE